MLTVHTFFNTILIKKMLTVHTFFNTILIKKMLTVHTFFKKTALTGSDNCTKCFTCRGMISDWLQTDDPWHTHAIKFPFCIFVRFMKGDAFIRKCNKELIMKKISSSLEIE